MRVMATVVCVASLALSGLAAEAAALDVGTGLSIKQDAKAAGAEAAQKARDALGHDDPNLVLVHYAGPLIPKAQEVVDGVASVFPDRDGIFGCGAYSALTQDGNNGAVAVLALSGDVAVNIAVAPTSAKKDDAADVDCGESIGTLLKLAYGKTDKPGKLLLLFGACHVPRNASVVKGITKVLGEACPIVGAAACQDSVVVRGKVAKSKTNVGILLRGDFTCGFGLRKDMSTEGLIASARQAFQSALGEDRDRTELVLVFDCGGRRGAMLKQKIFEGELAAMREVAGDVPIFGFYGSGEMGCEGAGQAPRGVGYHIAACAVKSSK
ncbi:MAG: FIST C-terminal domain-containing protein [Candidatus Brocadiia bacterium]